MIDIKKKYRTRSGLEVVLASTEMPGSQPVVGKFYDVKRHEWVCAEWCSNGQYYLDDSGTMYDLIEVKEPKVLKCWVNFYRDKDPTVHPTREKADITEQNFGCRIGEAVEVTKIMEE